MISKPIHFDKGDKIGVVTPSWCGPALFPEQFRRGLNNLRTIGLLPVTSEFSTTNLGERTASPENRANDINKMFADKSIKGIIASIGGVYSNEILPLIDYELAASNPKIFIGYSDITAILLALHTKSKIVTFYGPMAMTQFGAYPNILTYTQHYFLKTLFSVNKPIIITCPGYWTDEICDWESKEGASRKRGMKRGRWEWLTPGSAEGNLMGGCLNSLLRLRGTPFNPDYSSSILFWEIPEGVDVNYIDLMLTDISLTDNFNKIQGMVVGRIPGYNKSDKEVFKKILLKYVEKLNIPILLDAPFGHCDPIATLPIGVKATINSYTDSFIISETGVC